MKKIILSLLLIVQFNMQASANECTGPGVAITFDDLNINEWYAARYLFIKHNAKATFFVSHAYKIDEIGFEKLRKIQEDGNEIASHSLSHKGIKKDYYSDPALIEQYVDEEIIPSIKILEENGLNISSFAHPYGQHTPEYDEKLLQYFLFLRATEYGHPIKYRDKVFYSRNTESGLIYGIGIDNGYDYSLDEIREGLIRAKNNNEVLILYGHKITDEEGKYHIPPAKVDEILKAASELGLHFYTVSELRTLCR